MSIPLSMAKGEAYELPPRLMAYGVGSVRRPTLTFFVTFLSPGVVLPALLRATSCWRAARYSGRSSRLDAHGRAIARCKGSSGPLGGDIVVAESADSYGEVVA